MARYLIKRNARCKYIHQSHRGINPWKACDFQTVKRINVLCLIQEAPQWWGLVMLKNWKKIKRCFETFVSFYYCKLELCSHCRQNQWLVYISLQHFMLSLNTVWCFRFACPYFAVMLGDDGPHRNQSRPIRNAEYVHTFCYSFHFFEVFFGIFAKFLCKNVLHGIVLHIAYVFSQSNNFDRAITEDRVAKFGELYVVRNVEFTQHFCCWCSCRRF